MSQMISFFFNSLWGSLSEIASLPVFDVNANKSFRSFKLFLLTYVIRAEQHCYLTVSVLILLLLFICLTHFCGCLGVPALQHLYRETHGARGQPVTVKHKQRYTEAFHVSVRHFSVDISESSRRHARRRERGRKKTRNSERERLRWMASLKNTTIVPSHFHQWDVCEINV